MKAQEKKSPIIGRRDAPKNGRRATSEKLKISTQSLGLRTGRDRLVPLPEPLKWAPPPREAQLERALPVLLEARRRFKAGEDFLSAVASAGESGIESEYARRAIREVLGEWNLMSWSEHFRRTRHEVFRAFDRAIALCRKTKHRGGWRVTHIKPKAA